MQIPSKKLKQKLLKCKKKSKEEGLDMSLYKKLLVAGVAMMAGVVLTACSADDESDNTANQKISYESALKNKDKDDRVYKLAFFENKADDDIHNQYFSLGYYKNGKLIQKELDSYDNYSEVIDPALQIPYVVIDDSGEYHVHRPPYSMYNSPETNISGKVSEKSEQ
ncbi:hypothetical protein PV941_04150 [Ligilactobacillus salivarius]|nr:hypothetical protein [Ligilactobacillus salivarius]